jgi:hypothetical protein
VGTHSVLEAVEHETRLDHGGARVRVHGEDPVEVSRVVEDHADADGVAERHRFVVEAGSDQVGILQ